MKYTLLFIIIIIINHSNFPKYAVKYDDHYNFPKYAVKYDDHYNVIELESKI